MSDRGFAYVVRRGNRTPLTVHRDTYNAVKAFAKLNDMSMTTATFLIIQTGMAYLMDKDRLKKGNTSNSATERCTRRSSIN